MRCERHRGYLPWRRWFGGHYNVTNSGTEVWGEQCLGCQAERAKQQKIARSMQQLRDTYLDPGPNFLSTLLANTPAPVVNLDRTSGIAGRLKSHSAKRWLYLAGISGAVAAAGAIATVTRKPRLIS